MRELLVNQSLSIYVIVLSFSQEIVNPSGSRSAVLPVAAL